MERLYAIMRPFDFRAELQRREISPAIGVCWLGALVPTIPLWFDTTLHEAWKGRDHCKCFHPLDNVSTPNSSHINDTLLQKLWMFWNIITNFIIPTALIILIWIIMAYHFSKRTILDRSNRILKRVTLKMVLLAALFLISIAPFCIVFTKAAFETPKTTMWLDRLFPLTILNSLLQPIIYISSFAKVREAFKTKVCCQGLTLQKTHIQLKQDDMVEIPLV